jgi:hypothetical protein
MKKLCFIIVLLLSMQLSIAQTVKNSLVIQHLKGKVKRIETGLFDSDKDGKIDTLATHNRFIDLFDENGNEVENSYIDKDGLLVSKTVEKYNGKSEKTEEDYFGKNGVQESGTIFKYDDRGNLVESDHDFIPDKKNSNKTLYKYDDKGNNIEEDAYSTDGVFKYKNAFKYDNKGNKIEMEYWHAKEDTIRVKWTFNYNDASDEIQQDRYTPGGVLQIENTFTYNRFDNMGNWVLVTRESKGISKEFANYINYSVTKRKIYYY